MTSVHQIQSKPFSVGGRLLGLNKNVSDSALACQNASNRNGKLSNANPLNAFHSRHLLQRIKGASSFNSNFTKHSPSLSADLRDTTQGSASFISSVHADKPVKTDSQSPTVGNVAIAANAAASNSNAFIFSHSQTFANP
jgi:hypothetical protein